MVNILPVLSRVAQSAWKSHKFVRYTPTIAKMSDTNVREGLPLSVVTEVLNSYANQKLAASWDNVGLLIEPRKPKLVKNILLTNDLTEDVMQEAINLNTDLIISYHPPIFAPLKSITSKTWKERITGSCLENKIALYSPHTSWDAIKGGINDWLLEPFDIETSEPIVPDTEPGVGIGRICTLKSDISVSEAVSLVKKRTQLPYVRLACARKENNTIRSIAVCAGSGASVLKDVKADLYITGEMLHHDILDAVHVGANVILTNHSDSERGFLKSFAPKLTELLNNSVDVSISLFDADPLKTV